MRPDAAVAGCGAITALGAGLGVLEQALPRNSSGLRECPSSPGRTYQTNMLGRVPDEVVARLRAENEELADAHAFLLASGAAREAIANCATLWEAVPPARRGLVLSTTKADFLALERIHAGQACSPAARRHVLPGLLAEDLAADFGIAGPVACISAACISGILSIRQGALMIRNRQADAALVVGVDQICDLVLGGFSSLKSLDPGGCRPFDTDRRGLSLGEGSGALVLARRELVDGSAWVVKGWASSNDANHLTGPSRDGAGLALAIDHALRRAGARAGEIDYVNAHGTATPYNDATESMALRRVFGERVPPFSSCKGMLGHTLGSAGILETIVCLVGARMRLLPGTPRLRRRDPVVPDAVLLEPRPAEYLRRILKINCGFGGTNAALVLERAAG